MSSCYYRANDCPKCARHDNYIISSAMIHEHHPHRGCLCWYDDDGGNASSIRQLMQCTRKVDKHLIMDLAGVSL